jgi:hypothetical protein
VPILHGDVVTVDSIVIKAVNFKQNRFAKAYKITLFLARICRSVADT